MRYNDTVETAQLRIDKYRREAAEDDNPYLAAWADAEQEELDNHRLYLKDKEAWSEGLTEFFRQGKGRGRRRALVGRYSWAVPCRAALDVLAAHGPLLEVGAGTGYWAMLLRRRGVDVLAYDLHPPRPGCTDNHWHKDTHTHTEVLVGGPAVVTTHPSRTLFLCWPPYDKPLAHSALSLYKGDRLVYAGEGSGGCTGCARFWKLLEKEWEKESCTNLPQWEGIHDYLTVYRRKGPTAG